MTKQVMKSNQQFAYAAGIVDGEGCLSVIYDKGHNQYSSRIQVVMTNDKPLRILLGLFGGSLCATKMASNGQKIPYHYTASGKNAKALLSRLGPLLIEKRDQAEVLTTLIHNVEEWNQKSRQRGNLPQDVLAFRGLLKQRAHDLKLESVLGVPAGRNLDKRETLAYLTAVLEAEGCFTIIRGNKDMFYATIVVQTCCKAVLGELEKQFGGTTIARKNTGDNRKPIFTWRVKGQAAADTCRAIAPYLSFRHEEADLLRQLQNTTNLWAKKVGRGGMPVEVTAKRIGWMQRIRQIHNPARAETKSEQPAMPVSDSPIYTEPSGVGPVLAAA